MKMQITTNLQPLTLITYSTEMKIPTHINLNTSLRIMSL